MSQGSTRITVRLPDALIAAVEAEIEKRKEHSLVEPEDFSVFVRRAIRNEISHRRRGRKCRRQKPKLDKDGWPQLVFRTISANPED